MKWAEFDEVIEKLKELSTKLRNLTGSSESIDVYLDDRLFYQLAHATCVKSGVPYENKSLILCTCAGHDFVIRKKPV